MKFVYLLLVLPLFFGDMLCAQIPADSLPVQKQDSITKKRIADFKRRNAELKRKIAAIQKRNADSLVAIAMMDSVSERPVSDSGWRPSVDQPFIEQLIKQIYQQHPYFGFDSPPIRITSDKKEYQGKETLFYSLMSLLLLFALFRETFSKYVDDLYRVFFRTTLKQRQISELLIQTPLPSLLLNLFFFIIGGLYIAFFLHYINRAPIESFWLLALYCAIGLAAMYTVKFFSLKITGWVFNLKEATDSYVFIVFVINKIIGIYLLPFLVLLAFTQGNLSKIAFTISWLGVAGLMAYRFILTYITVRNQIKVNSFHFFVYMLAFEVVPLLLIYKLLLVFF